MANLIKKKLVQELARFTKNLQPDAIKISSLKGEGELASLELDEEFLTAILQLPAWLKLSKVICRNIRIKIHWTKLKSEPVLITMSDVDVYVVTCDEYKPRESMETKSNPHEYGLVDKVIDGLSLTVSNVTVHFKSPGFNSDLTISEVNMKSVDKDFNVTKLENTRLSKGQSTTTRKLISWQSLRIQAIADMCDDVADGQMSVAPILLITNQSSLRLTLTKRMTDCVLTATRLELRFDTFLWVLTSSQLFAAAMFARTLSLLIQRVTRQKREMAAKSSVSYKYGGGNQPDAASKELAHGIQASHHLRLGTLELQLCDDQVSRAEGGNRGASMQLLLRGLALDFYPNRAAWSQRQECAIPNEYTVQCQTWITTLLQRYSWEGQAQMGHAPDSPLSRTASGKYVVHRPSLRENWLIASLRDIKIGCVSTGRTEHLPEALFQSSKKELHIPDSHPAFQLEFMSYFYEPAMPDYFVPWPHLYGWVNPMEVIFHEPTLLWMLNLSKTMATHVNGFLHSLPPELFEESTEEAEKDIRLEFIMPKVTLPLSGCPSAAASTVLYPHALQFQASRMTVTNCGHHGTSSTRTELQLKAQLLQSMSFFSPDGKFPYRPGDLNSLPSFAEETPQTVGETSTDASQASSTGSVRPPPRGQAAAPTGVEAAPSPTYEPGAAPVIWLMSAEKCWLDFLYKSASSDKEKNVPFVGALPLELWVCALNATEDKPGRFHALLQSTEELQVLLERAELLWLLSLRDEIKTLHSTILAMFLDPTQQQTPQAKESTGTSATKPSSQPAQEQHASKSADDKQEEELKEQTFAAISLQSGIRVSLLLPNPESRHRLLTRSSSSTSLLGGNFSSLLPSAIFAAPTPSPPPVGNLPLVHVPDYSHMDDNVSLGAVSFDSSLGDASSLQGEPIASPSHMLSDVGRSLLTTGLASSAPPSSTSSSSSNLAAGRNMVNNEESLSSGNASRVEGDHTKPGKSSLGPQKRSPDTLSRGSVGTSHPSSLGHEELASLFHVSVTPVLADIQVANESTTVIVAARKPRIATQSLVSATQLRKFVAGGISKNSVHADDAASYEGRILARVSLGKSVTSEAAEIGIIEDESADELLFGLLSAEARDVSLTVHERYLDLLGAFFKLPPSDGTLPMHVKAMNCDATVERHARPSGIQPEPNRVRVSDAIVSCMPSGQWVVGHLTPPAHTDDATTAMDKTTHSGEEASGSDSTESLAQLRQENHQLTQSRKLAGSQLANCRLALDQAALERDALLQTILRLQEEITKANIAQDEMHTALRQARHALKQLR